MGMGMSKLQEIKGGKLSGNQLLSGIVAGNSIGTMCNPKISYYSDSACATANYLYTSLTPVLYDSCFSTSATTSQKVTACTTSSYSITSSLLVKDCSTTDGGT